MAEFTHEEQVEIVRKAFALETAIKVESANIDLLKSQVFDRFPSYQDVFDDKPPAKPQRIILAQPTQTEPVLPKPPKANYSISEHLKTKPIWIVLLIVTAIVAIIAFKGSQGIVLSFFGSLLFPICCVACVVSYSGEHKKRNENLANSPEYLAAVDNARRSAAEAQLLATVQTQNEQAKLDAQFEADTKHYEEVLLPEYERLVADHRREYVEMRAEYEQDEAEWKAKRDDAIAQLEDDIAANKEALVSLYDSTGIISIHYREIPVLEWLYDDMRTSDHDIRYATELLDRDRQRIATEEAGKRTASAIERLQDQVHQDAIGIMQLQGVQIGSLQNLEAISSDVLYTTEDIYESSKKVLFHQRVNTIDIGVREWRRHKAKKLAK